MKVIIQRVLEASVKVEGEVISNISKGLLVLIGISKDDSQEDSDFIARKILNIKFFEDDLGKKWSQNVMQKEYEVLCVSQFTLCHKLKGNKLDFHHAMKPEDSEVFYNKFLNNLRNQYKPEKIKDGKFGALMQVSLCNDGPVTIDLESQKKNSNKDGELHESKLLEEKITN